MADFPFLGPSYQFLSKNFDAQRTVNLYLAKSESGTSKAAWCMIGTPGLAQFCTFENGPVRGEWNMQGRGFVVSGNKLYEVFADFTSTARGTLNSSSGNVGMSDNGLQLIVVDGPDGYIFTIATNAFVQISDMNFRGATTVTFDSGYFVLNEPDTDVYYISGLYDGLVYDALEFASAENSPDGLVAVSSVHGQVWLFGTKTIQVVYNQGGADFPYATVQGVTIEYGCSAPFSVVNTANTLFWLGSDKDGSGIVWMSTGYSPQRISTQAIETIIQGYANLGDVVGMSYQEDGHYFYKLSFPGGDSDLVYDVTTQQWHERAYFSNGAYSRQKQAFHMFIFGKHLVGDYEAGILYEQKLGYYTDNGQPIRRLRASPHYFDNNSLDYIYYHAFQLDMQTGIGQDGGTADGGDFSDSFSDSFAIGDITINPDTQPVLILQWSNDGGYTWSNEVQASAGLIGQYGIRAMWRRLGRARDRVFRVIFTGACPVLWMNAKVDFTQGNN